MQTFDFQPNHYSFQTIGTNVFPPELASANNFPSSVFPSKLVVQSDDFRKPPEVNNNDYSDYEYEEYEYDGPGFPEPPGFQEPPGFPEPPGFQESPRFQEPQGFHWKPPPNFSIFQNSLNSPLPGMFSMVELILKFQAQGYIIR